ncbi:DinB family protein [Brevibacillus choshinensis]|uniref:DinB family protein n=1 Tax=Brevibacillus choshinensis TaxID=54911 RepID=A0ABX7FGL2_BRECH|nr:DinB family protein [Brevibacillus choshinensis]QRG65328.1 DinB family protein [Brevibacillus choshinensis]
MSQSMIRTAVSVRQLVLHQIQSIPEDLFDKQPPQFANTIRWNVGHIAVGLDYFLSLGLPVSSSSPDHFAAFFQSGTKPSDWTATPPSKEELVQCLSAQLANLSELPPALLEHNLESPIEMGPLRFETAGEVFNFAFIHETMHFSTITSLLKVLQYENEKGK